MNSRTLLSALFLCGLCLAHAAGRPEVRVEGEHAFSKSDIESFLNLSNDTKEWSAGDWESWAEDGASLIVESYRDLGYFDARADVALPNLDSLRTQKKVAVQVRIQEGPRYQFGIVEIHPSPGPFPSYAPEDLRSRPGKPFDKSFIYLDRRDLLRFYGDAGFLKATAAESLFYDTTRKAVNVTFRVNPGRALVMDTLLLNLQREGDTLGRGKTSPELLHRLFTVRRGDTLSLKEISSFERKLKSTRVFNFVRIRDSLLQNAEGRSALVLTAEEKVPGELDLTGFWENLYGFGTSLGWSHANMGGRLQEGHATVTFAQRKQSLFLGYGAPLLFGTSIRFDNDFIVNWYQDAPLVRDTGWFKGNFDISNSSKFSRQIFPWMRVVSGAELLGKSTQSDSGRQRDFNLNYLNSIFFEQLDDAVNPTRGWRIAPTWGNGGPILENGELAVFKNRHNWLEVEDAAYLPLGDWLVLALRLDAGRFFGHGGINSERFFLGGPRSVRSEDWHHICPEIADSICNDDIEPAYFAIAELRLQPFRPSWISTDGNLKRLIGLQIVPFADYGNIWKVGHNLTPMGEGRAVGVGLRYVFLALFNIRLDYAWDPRDAGQNRWILDLSQAF